MGWAIGRGEVYTDEQYGDKVEAEALYSILEQEVIPLFYQRNGQNLPHAWIAKMKATMSTVTPVFNTHRMVQEYAERFYLPSEERYRSLVADNYERARQLDNWMQFYHKRHNVRIVSVEGDDHTHRRRAVKYQRTRSTGRLTDDIQVQTYYGAVDAEGQIQRQGVATLGGCPSG